MYIVPLTIALLIAAPSAPSSADLFRRSYVHEGRGEILAALDDLAQITQPGPVQYVWHLRRGWLQYLAGQHAESAASYAQAIALEPRALEPRLGAMLPLLAARRWREAEEQGLAALALAPGEFVATSRLAYIHYSQGRYAKAEGYYRQALAAFPSNVEMRTGLGWSLLKQAKPVEARAELEQVLAIAPDQLSAREGLASLP